MAARLFVVDSGGTSRQVAAARFFVVDSGGTTRSIQRLFVIDSGGTARQVYQAGVFSVWGGTVTSAAAGASTATIAFEADADIIQTTSGGGPSDVGTDWVTPTSLAPGSYTIRASTVSGAAPTGSAVDTDLALSSTRSWSHTQSGAGDTTTVLTITIKDGSGNTLASGDVSLRALAF
jgi:hypothetical protein